MSEQNIKNLLKDERLCASPNMKSFFRKVRNRHMNKVIRFEGKLWFVLIDGNHFAGVKVQEVACYGSKAKDCYPSWQHPSKWHEVTDWFWAKYWEQGKVSIPEIWNIKAPQKITSKEAHSI